MIATVTGRRPFRVNGSALLLTLAFLVGFWALANAVLTAEPGRRAPLLVLVVLPAVSLLGFGALARRHPDEPWLFRLMTLGLVAKLAASYLRYLTLTKAYGGLGDATGYHAFGVDFARAFFGDEPSPALDRSDGTNFVRQVTGYLYVAIGPDQFAGFLAFGFVAFWGAYLWYRAGVVAVPALNRRLYLLLLMFVPSIAFWPSSIGKESLMALGLGAVALGVALALQRRAGRAVVPILAGGWLLTSVRPHLAAMCAIGLAFAYLFGRVRLLERRPAWGGLGRAVGIVVVVVTMLVVVSQAVDFLGLEGFSGRQIEARLERQSENTAQGGSAFEAPEPSLSPLHLPLGLATVLFRPLPWEATSGFMTLASVESILLGALLAARFNALVAAFRRLRRDPLILYCLVFIAIFATAFSSFRNFGLLVRQRSLVMPAVLLLCCVRLGRGRPEDVIVPARPLPRSAWRPLNLAVDALGTSVRFEGDGIPGFLPEMLADFDRSQQVSLASVTVRRKRASGADRYAVESDRAVLADGIDAQFAGALALWQLAELASRSTTRVALQAGCVAHDGSGILLAGRSGTGKSTLTAALVCDGFEFLTDELTGVALHDGRLWPFPRPVVLDEDAIQALVSFNAQRSLQLSTPPHLWPTGPEGERYVRADDLRQGSRGGPVPPGLVLFLERDMAGPPSERLSPASAFVRLAGHAANLDLMGGIALVTLGRLVSSCPAFILRAADLETGVELLGSLRHERKEGTVRLLPVPAGSRSPGMLQRGGQTTSVELEGGTVVYASHTRHLHLLNESAALVWRLCDGSLDTMGVVAGIAELTRRPAGELVESVVHVSKQLRELNLLAS